MTTDLSPSIKQKIDRLLLRFPADQKRSAVIMALRFVQNESGWLSDGDLNAVASYLGLPPIDVYEVASFYTMLRRKPLGRHVLKVCVSISCGLCGSHDLLAHLEKRLGIALGETTADGLFTLQEAECLAACCDAPVLQLNDQAFFRRLSLEDADALLARLRMEESVDG